MIIQAQACCTHEQRNGVEDIDQPIRHDGPGPEGDRVIFPGKHDHADIAALAGEPGGEAVAGEKEWAEKEQPE